jgi:hypothetical protein
MPQVSIALRVSKNNLSILVATALLGVLLYTILRFFDEVPVAEIPVPIRSEEENSTFDVPTSSPARKPEQTTDPDTPYIAGYEDLLNHLDTKGLNGQRLIADSARWFQAKGYLNPNDFLGVRLQGAPASYYDTLDEPTLIAMSDEGDLGATQSLAERRSFSDPFEAIELYYKAAEQGSVNSLLRIASLLETFGDVALDDFESDPEYRRKLKPFRVEGANMTLGIEAFSYALMAVRDGGSAVASPDVVQWVEDLGNKLEPDALLRACRISANMHMNLAEARRINGYIPLSSDPPAVFLGEPELESKLPCADTRHAVFPLLDLEGCDVETVQVASGEIQALYVCAR